VSFSIPFALVPLVLLTRRADLMGALVNRRAALIIALSVYLLWSTIAGQRLPPNPPSGDGGCRAAVAQSQRPAGAGQGRASGRGGDQPSARAR
jgi:hypothetical protein